MITDSTIVFGLIAVAAALMASNRVRFDIVALLVVVALMLTGVLTVGQSLSGFGSPVVIMVAGLLIVGEMLARTGVASLIGDWILKHGGHHESRLLVLIMLGSGVLGAVMSSTAVVAIFIPIVLRIAADSGINASRLLLPMSYAALISGMLTLIATTPNIVVHEELKAEGFEGFGFFGFTTIGAVILVVAIAYVLIIGRWLLPASDEIASTRNSRRALLALWRTFNDQDEFARLRIGPTSSLKGCSVREAALESRYAVRLIGIESGSAVSVPASSTRHAEDDVLILAGPPDKLERAASELHLSLLPDSPNAQQRRFTEIGGAAVLVHPDSELLGRTVREAEFHTRYRLQVLGLRRDSRIVQDYADTPLAPGDSLFVQGTWSRVRQLAESSHDFVVLELPEEFTAIIPARDKLPFALAILAGMILLSVFEVVPLVTAVLIAALAAVATKCLSMEEAYRSIHWSSIVLIAGMLPLADALTETGGTDVVVGQLMAFAGDAGPYKMMTVLFFLTAGLSLVLSNTASAVLVAPIAIYAADALAVSPYPFAVAVIIAASAAYSTPVSTPVVTLVVDPGRYRFTDFIKAGVPLLFLTYVATLLITPLVFPF